MKGDSSHRSNKSRSEDMRARLITAARRLFIENGFANTGTPEIVRAARVTRGALYHHFDGKSDLFRAVVRAEAAAVAQHIDTGSTPATDRLYALRAGTLAYFSAMQVDGRVRLLLLDGPAVLGFAEMASIDADTGGATLRAGLADLLGDRGQTLDAMSDVLSAAFDRAAIAVADGAPPARYIDALLQIVASLATSKTRS